MSYSIIFETKIVKLSDGKILHFSLQGCNNDNNGRSRGDFDVTLYENKDEFIKMARSYQNNSKPYKESKVFELKIGSRFATYYDYGEHLIRMLKRAEPYNEFIKNREVRATVYESVDLIEPEKKHFNNPQEFNFYEYIDKGPVKYRINQNTPDITDEIGICNLIESKKPISFFIGRKED